jgi:hypothetical protein
MAIEFFQLQVISNFFYGVSDPTPRWGRECSPKPPTMKLPTRGEFVPSINKLF